MQLNEAVSKRLTELLSERNMTQYQLFMKSGVPKSTIIRNSMKIRGNNSYVSAVNSSITNSQIVIDGDNCHLILQEGTMINNSKIVIRQLKDWEKNYTNPKSNRG